MTWICLEGIDRSGKSTIAEQYKQQGYEVVHFSKPDKKYSDPSYVGPSYLDDILDILIQYNGKDVVWDRSWYGELIWPHVYGRDPLLTNEDIEVIREFEERNDTQRFLLVDNDREAHWERCKANNEPLTIHNFKLAYRLYEKMGKDYGFKTQSLQDFKGPVRHIQDKTKDAGTGRSVDRTTKSSSGKTITTRDNPTQANKTPEQIKLERANAINTILSKRLIKQKGPVYDDIEANIKQYLTQQLQDILGTNKSNSQPQLTNDDIHLLKTYAHLIKQRLNNK